MTKRFSNDQLLNEIRIKAKQEQNLTLEVIELIKEVNDRRLYLKLGFGSLFDFVTKDLGYEPGSAMRRIQTARMVSEIPEVKSKIEDGRLSLSVISQVQSFFKKEETIKGEKLSKHQKVEILAIVENKSAREAEKELVKLSPETVKKTESQRELTDNLTELKLVIDCELKAQLDELKLLLSHQNPNMSYVELIRLMAKKMMGGIKRKNAGAGEVQSHTGIEGASNGLIAIPTSEWTSNSGATHMSAQEINLEGTTVTQIVQRPKVKIKTRYISEKVKRQIWQRDHGGCQYRDAETGRICNSRYQLQIDHIQRFSEGGGNDVENLRLLCRAHNSWRG